MKLRGQQKLPSASSLRRRRRVRYLRPWTKQQIPGAQKHAPRPCRIYGAPTLSLMDSYPIMGNPAWSPVVSLLGVPTLMNGPGNGPLAQNRSNSAYKFSIISKN